MRGAFVTGTDTGVGKTWIATALVHHYAQQGRRVAGIKPLACGARLTPEGWRHDDADLLRQHASVSLAYEEVNPCCLPEPVAPHLAARQRGLTLSAADLAGACAPAAQRADLLIVEGVGGWQVPLNARETTADLARALGLPVILVVGLRLGCLNHALLTRDAILRSGLPWAGWVANTLVLDLPRRDENIATLAACLPPPHLATVPYCGGFEASSLAACFSPAALRQGLGG